ncbi:hypothetical protein KC19_10G086800, partial [Ceratodon purpureus]
LGQVLWVFCHWFCCRTGIFWWHCHARSHSSQWATFFLWNSGDWMIAIPGLFAGFLSGAPECERKSVSPQLEFSCLDKPCSCYCVPYFLAFYFNIFLHFLQFIS